VTVDRTVTIREALLDLAELMRTAEETAGVNASMNGRAASGPR
jgi:hypothetical protein